MNDHPPLETERLRLVPLDPRHAEALHRVFADPEAMRFWVEPPHRTVEQTAKMIARMVGGAEHVWSIVPKDDSDPIGIIYYLGNPEPPGMGYIQHPASWGKGLMSEAVQAALAHGFGPMGFDRVELWIDERNKRSRSLATRNGFVRQGRFQMRYAHDKQPHIKLTYGLLACTWRGEPEPGAVLERVETILPVANVRRAALWYRNRLGFRISFFYGEPPTHGAVTLSPWTASGSTIQLTQAEAPAPGVALFFHVSGDIDALHSEIAARGVTIERPLQRTAWGQREFAVRDLDGYLIRFGSGG